MNRESQIVTNVASWRVLLVDDEPAVHEVSRLILSGLRFDGRDIELLSAASAAQARDILGRQRDVALILLDVVMETDDAGLGLVHHIREQLRDGDVQIVVRTGQPGMAPEDDVVQRYEINGYFLKVDITSQRLQSIVVSALRNYRHTRSLRSARAYDARPSTAAEIDKRHSALAAELADAHERSSVLLQAQPEIALTTNQVRGIELVPQWKTSFGLLTAARVAGALSAGVARRSVALWLLDQACFWARSWRAGLGTGVAVSVPLVAECLADSGTPAAIADSVRDSKLAPGTLDFLISEEAMLGERADIRPAVDTLRSLGVSFTLSDFGGGTIALGRLSQLLPDRLKIHRLYVRNVASDPQRTAMARSLIALGQTLNAVTIADGIESDSDAQFFRWEGCELGQGDALAPACAPAEVSEFLTNGRRSSH